MGGSLLDPHDSSVGEPPARRVLEEHCQVGQLKVKNPVVGLDVVVLVLQDIAPCTAQGTARTQGLMQG